MICISRSWNHASQRSCRNPDPMRSNSAMQVIEPRQPSVIAHPQAEARVIVAEECMQGVETCEKFWLKLQVSGGAFWQLSLI
jgi:hypothetical protein